MIAAFLSIDFIFRINIRSVQSYFEIVKTIIVAVFIHRVQGKHCWSYATACFLASLILFSVPDTLIYNVPSIVCGCTLGLQNDEAPMIKNYLEVLFVNFFMIIFEILMYGLFMEINLFAVYQSQIVLLLEEITGDVVSGSVFLLGVIAYYSFKAVISALLLFAPYRIVSSNLKKIKMYHQV